MGKRLKSNPENNQAEPGTTLRAYITHINNVQSDPDKKGVVLVGWKFKTISFRVSEILNKHSVRCCGFTAVSSKHKLMLSFIIVFVATWFWLSDGSKRPALPLCVYFVLFFIYLFWFFFFGDKLQVFFPSVGVRTCKVQVFPQARNVIHRKRRIESCCEPSLFLGHEILPLIHHFLIVTSQLVLTHSPCHSTQLIILQGLLLPLFLFTRVAGVSTQLGSCAPFTSHFCFCFMILRNGSLCPGQPDGSIHFTETWMSNRKIVPSAQNREQEMCRDFCRTRKQCSQTTDNKALHWNCFIHSQTKTGGYLSRLQLNVVCNFVPTKHWQKQQMFHFGGELTQSLRLAAEWQFVSIFWNHISFFKPQTRCNLFERHPCETGQQHRATVPDNRMIFKEILWREPLSLDQLLTNGHRFPHKIKNWFYRSTLFFLAFEPFRAPRYWSVVNCFCRQGTSKWQLRQNSRVLCSGLKSRGQVLFFNWVFRGQWTEVQ